MEKYNIEELVTEANKRLKEDNPSSQDARLSTELTIRRVRDYASKNLISKSLREGKNVFYTEQHLNQLLALRHLHSSGLSDSFIKNNLDLSNPQELQTYLSSTEPQNLQNQDFKLVDNNLIANSLPQVNHVASASELSLTSFNFENSAKVEALGAIDKIASRNISSLSTKNNALRGLTAPSLANVTKSNLLASSAQNKKINYQLIEGDKYRLFIDEDLNSDEQDKILNEIKNKLNIK